MINPHCYHFIPPLAWHAGEPCLFGSVGEDSDLYLPGEPTNQYSNWSVNDKTVNKDWSLYLIEDSDNRERWTDIKV